MQIFPGVRLTLSKSGLGLTAGPRGAHISVNTSGRLTTSVGIPGSGISNVTRRNLLSRRRPTSRRSSDTWSEQEGAPPAKSVGPAWAQTLAAALFADGSLPSVRQIQAAKGPESTTALYVELIKFAIPGKVDTRIHELFEALLAADYRPSADRFIVEQLGASSIAVDIARGFRASLPLSDDNTWRLSYVEVLQEDDRARATIVAEGLDPSTVAGASLAELYIAEKRWEDVVMLAADVTNADDAGTFLMIEKAIALRELGRIDDAHRVFTSLTTTRTIGSELRTFAMEEWAKTPAPLKGARLVGFRKAFARIVALSILERTGIAVGLVSLVAGWWPLLGLSVAVVGGSILVRAARQG